MIDIDHTKTNYCRPAEGTFSDQKLDEKTLLRATQRAILEKSGSACFLFEYLERTDQTKALNLLLSLTNEDKLCLLSNSEASNLLRLLSAFSDKESYTEELTEYQGDTPVQLNDRIIIAETILIQRRSASLHLIVLLGLTNTPNGINKMQTVLASASASMQARLLFYPDDHIRFKIAKTDGECYANAANLDYCNNFHEYPFPSNLVAKLLEKASPETLVDVIALGYAINPKQAKAVHLAVTSSSNCP